MKKFLLAAAVVLLATSVYAEDCKYNGANAFCQWSGPTSCWGINTEYGDAPSCSKPNCSCSVLLENCEKNGTLFTGVTSTGEDVTCSGTMVGGNDPNRTPLGCCAWDTEGGKCWPIWSGIDREDGIDGAEKVQSCKGGGNAFWTTSCPADGGAGGCPTGTPVFDGRPGGPDNCGYYCRWDETGDCERVSPDPTGQYGDATASCGEAIDICRLYGDLYLSNTGCTGTVQNPERGGGSNPNPPNPPNPPSQPSSSSVPNPPNPPDDPWAPIITLKGSVSGNALTAMQNAVNLQVTGAATFRVYDMKGKVLRTQKVEQGNYNVPLQLPRGLYIIQATSGSWKQTVKVAVK